MSSIRYPAVRSPCPIPFPPLVAVRRVLASRAKHPRLQIWIILIRQGHPRRILHLLIILLQQRLIDLHRRRRERDPSHEIQPGVADELAREPQEGLLEVVVGLGGDVVVLQVLLAVEGDGLGLHLALLDVHFVAAQHDGHVLAHAN